MVVSIGAVASAAQGVSYYERDGYYAKDDAAHREASAWFGKGAAALGLVDTVDPDLFTDILAGEVPDGSGLRLGRRNREGEIEHRPGRDLTFSAPKSVSLAALIGDDERIAGVHDAAVRKALAWIEANAAETRMMDPELGRMVRTGDQSIVAATFMHEVSRNLDPQLHTHAVIANMVLGEDRGTPRCGGTPRSGKWRTMANEKLYASKMLIGALYRAELARGLEELGYAVEKTHADGRFETAGVPRQVIEAFSTRRAEIEAAMEGRGQGAPADNQRIAERAALMTRSHKRDVDKEALRESWQRQASELGFDARDLVAEARHWQAAYPARSLTSADHDREAERGVTAEAARAAAWAIEHFSEREAVFARTDLLTATLAWSPGKVSIEEAEAAVGRMEKAGTLHAAKTPVLGDALTTDKALFDETETIALMERGQDRSKRVMRKWIATPLLHNGRLTQGQKEAVTTILSSSDRVLGVQGYAGTGKTAMLDRARSLAEKSGWRVVGLAPSASAAATLGSEAGIRSETLQRFLARNAGVAEGRLKPRAERRMRASFRKTVLVVDEGSLASTVQARDLLRIADRLRIPRVVLVGDEKQLDAVDAGKPFAQLQQAGMQTVVMDEILRQKDPALKEAVRASLAGDVRAAFGKLGESVAQVKADNLAGAAAARWLKLSPEERENTGLMAPSHVMRQTVNGHIRERLAREGVIHGPALEGQRLVSRGYTTAEKMQGANYAPGDVVAFHRAYRSLG
ncbi:MAG: relaxase domain-containing protein, partial [Rhodospirillales bacterium]|nr:relaxase domain-containing protein [Rhodospirillales bacterium]